MARIVRDQPIMLIFYLLCYAAVLIKFTYYAQNYAQEYELCLVYYHYLYTNLHKEVNTYSRQFRNTVLLGCIYKMAANMLYVL